MSPPAGRARARSRSRREGGGDRTGPNEETRRENQGTVAQQADERRLVEMLLEQVQRGHAHV